jgi:hypothetical protein
MSNMAVIGKEVFALQAHIRLFLYSVVNQGISMDIRIFGKMKMCFLIPERARVVT